MQLLYRIKVKGGLCGERLQEPIILMKIYVAMEVENKIFELEKRNPRDGNS